MYELLSALNLPSTLIGGLIGLAIPFVFAWVYAKLNPDAVAKYFAKMLNALKLDQKTRNKIENMTGLEILEIGRAFITVTYDKELESVIDQLDDILAQLKKRIYKEG